MLELDLLLGNFLEEAFAELSEEDQGLFVRLLEESDPDLFLWLTGKGAHKESGANRIIEMIRHHAENRH